VGEAADSYPLVDEADPGAGRILERFSRAIVFVKPELVLVFDRLVARREASFECRLHAPAEFTVKDQRNIEVRAGDAACSIAMLTPDKLRVTQTNRCEPDPRARIKLREWHLTAATAAKARSVEFVTLLRPHRSTQEVPRGALLQPSGAGYTLLATLSDGRVTVLLPAGDADACRTAGLQGPGTIVVHRLAADGSVVQSLTVDALGAGLPTSPIQ